MVYMRTRSLCATALAVMLAVSLTSSAAARTPAGVRGTNTIVSTGTGRQTLEGAGLLYGVLAPGGDVRVIDLSAGHDGRFTVTAQIPATGGAAAQSAPIKAIRLAGVLVFKPTRANAKRSLAFSVAGSKFRLVLEGASTLNGAGVSGTVKLEGQGTVSINGQSPPLEWATAGKLVLPTKAALAAAAKAAKTTSTATSTTTTKTTTTATTATTATP
jgi:hypothetical protein